MLLQDFLHSIEVSQVLSWSELIEFSMNAFAKSNLNSPSVKETLSKLVQKDDTIEEKISKIQRFVARDIRYISMSELGHRVTPHTFESIVENQFGDCKDKSAVLVGLLRQLNLNAYPVLVATKRSIPSRLQVPSTSSFDHMIVCFELDSKTYCIDATDDNTHWRATPSWIQGKVILSLFKGATPKRLDEKGQRWQLESKAHITFDSDGAQLEKHSRLYKNTYAGNYRASLRGQKSVEMSKWAKV